MKTWYDNICYDICNANDHFPIQWTSSFSIGITSNVIRYSYLKQWTGKFSISATPNFMSSNQWLSAVLVHKLTICVNDLNNMIRNVTYIDLNLLLSNVVHVIAIICNTMSVCNYTFIINNPPLTPPFCCIPSIMLYFV